MANKIVKRGTGPNMGAEKTPKTVKDFVEKGQNVREVATKFGKEFEGKRPKGW